MPTRNAPRNPLADDPRPNVRLAHTREGSPERELFGEWYPAVPYVRADGTEYELPTLANGEPDTETQRAGFAIDPNYAARVTAVTPHYVLITEKG